MQMCSSSAPSVHRTGDNLGTTADRPEDKLCTSCGHLVHDEIAENTSAKPLVRCRTQGLELRPRRERRAGPPEATPTGTAPGDRAAAGNRGDRSTEAATGNRPEITATSRTIGGPREQLLGAATTGGGSGQPRATSRATGAGDRVRRPARRTITAAADAIGGSRRQLHGAGSGRPRPRRDSQSARQHERLAVRARQRDRRSGGRAAGPLDLIHRGAPHQLQDASAGLASRPATPTRGASTASSCTTRCT